MNVSKLFLFSLVFISCITSVTAINELQFEITDGGENWFSFQYNSTQNTEFNWVKNSHATVISNITLPSAGIAAVNLINITNGIYVNMAQNGNNTRVYIYEPGNYEVITSIIADAGGINKHIDCWFRVNDIDVPESNTKVQIAQSAETLIAVPIILQLKHGDYLTFPWASSDDASMRLLSTPGTVVAPARPLSPSAIITIKKVGSSDVN